MTAPHRALASSLRLAGIARGPSSRLPFPTTASLGCTSSSRNLRALALFTASKAVHSGRSLATTRTRAAYNQASRVGATRRYSAGAGEPATSRKWEFEEVAKQVKLNAELAEGGKDGKVIFVDVREPHELHHTGKIPGAINIPITTAVQSFHISEEDFEDLYGFPRPDKKAPLVFYCKAGVRARGAAALAQHAGWSDVGDYPGSWNDWEAKRGPVEPVKKQD